MILSLLSKYALPAMGIALAVAIGTATVQTARIGRLKADNAVLDSLVSNKDALIDAQNKSAQEMIRAAAEDSAKLTAAGDRAVALSTELARERAKRNTAVEKDYALPDCRTLLETDLAAVCPAHAERVRGAAGRLPGS